MPPQARDLQLITRNKAGSERPGKRAKTESGEMDENTQQIKLIRRVGGFLGKFFGAGIDAIFGGEPTKYEETTGAKVGWSGTGFDLASSFSASNEHGGILASICIK